MTPAHRKTLRTITAFVHENGYPPSLVELAPLLSLSMRGVHERLLKLSAAGLVTWKPSQARTLRLTDAGLRELGIAREAA